MICACTPTQTTHTTTSPRCSDNKQHPYVSNSSTHTTDQRTRSTRSTHTTDQRTHLRQAPVEVRPGQVVKRVLARRHGARRDLGVEVVGELSLVVGRCWLLVVGAVGRWLLALCLGAFCTLNPARCFPFSPLLRPLTIIDHTCSCSELSTGNGW